MRDHPHGNPVGFELRNFPDIGHGNPPRNFRLGRIRLPDPPGRSNQGEGFLEKRKAEVVEKNDVDIGRDRLAYI